MARGAPGEIDRLRREVERAMRDNHDAEDILPLLARLARAAVPESDAWIYAHRHLAELGVEHDPWRAALFARRVIARRPDDDGAWAVLGLAQSLLGHFRYAARAYEHALGLAPDNPWYAHNLGHLYDVALDRPADALPLLGRATFAQPHEADIAASYAHALARCGKVSTARRILRRATRHGGTADQMALARWLDAGAPKDWGARSHDGGAPRGHQTPRDHDGGHRDGEGKRVAGSLGGDVVAKSSPAGAGSLGGDVVAKSSPAGGTGLASRAGDDASPQATGPGNDESPETPRPKKARRRRTRERRTVGD